MSQELCTFALLQKHIPVRLPQTEGVAFAIHSIASCRAELKRTHATGVSFEFVVIGFFVPFAHGGCMGIAQAPGLMETVAKVRFCAGGCFREASDSVSIC